MKEARGHAGRLTEAEVVDLAASSESVALFVRHADFCRVFSDEKRLRIMWYLGPAERTVGEITAHLGVSLQNTSQHLRVLRDKGAVCTRRKGQTIYYRIANPKILAGCRLIRQALIEADDRIAYAVVRAAAGDNSSGVES
jgi:ArsR family transcriptional regulator